MTDYAVTKSVHGKIHFIHHLEKMNVAANLGDWISSPYYYYTEFFSRYNCVMHSVWSILWHEIERGDVVIFGGGGLLDNSDPLNKVLNRLLDKCDNVIIWGAGTHKYHDDNIFGKKTATTEINFNKALFAGIRDYQHPFNLDFLPCASCLHPAFSRDRSSVKIKRKIGVIKSALERSFAVSDIPSFVTNAEPIGTVVDYILSSEVILVSSYHGAFWSLLLGRKVVLPASRLGVEKYRYFKYPVGFYAGAKFDEAEILKIAADLPEIPDFLSESRALNKDFYHKVRNHIESIIPYFSDKETVQILAKRVAQMDFTIVEISNELRRLNHRMAELEASRATPKPA